MNKNKYNQGQTVIEVLVSLFIITVGIVGTLILASYSIHAGTQSRERVQAALLAQEGIEIVKNNRDTNWLNKATVPWANNLLNNANFKIGTNNITLVGNKLETPFDNFSRNITITKISDDKYEVDCKVSWTDTSGQHDVTAIDYITNWQKNNS